MNISAGLGEEADGRLQREFWDGSRRLRSLWEMLAAYSYKFAKLMDVIHEIERMTDQLVAQRGDQVIDVSALNFSQLDRLEVNDGILPLTCLHVNRMADLMGSHFPLSKLQRMLEETRGRLLDEASSMLYLSISKEMEYYYNTPMLFGERAHDRFPDAIDDIEEAGKCIATGRGTGAVMHLMRVMEVGLKELAKTLGIPYAPSWESYLKQISNNIARKHELKCNQWKQDEPFFRDVSGDLLVVKQAWRNPSMHIVRKYSPDEAIEIFKAVRLLMQRLTSR